MRHAADFVKRAPSVSVAVDASHQYGRAVLRGVTRYANLQRRWMLHDGMRLDFLDRLPKCDGLIVAGVPEDYFEDLLSLTAHAVICSGSGDPSSACVVTMDDVAVGAIAAEHLLSCQLKHFAYYGWNPGRTTLSINRLNGFQKQLARAGFTCEIAPVPWPTQAEFFTQPHHPRLIEWLRRLPRPVGVFCADDSVAKDLATACLNGGVAVPDHVAIVGVNNDDLLCEVAWPPLSSVDCDFSRVGYAAAKLLDRLIAGERVPAAERVIRLPPIGVVQRQSTSTLAVADPQIADALRFVRLHACDPCSVEDVLAHLAVGRRWLERRFVETVGSTPYDEITRVRIETARRLLRQPDLTIPEVARRCGFATTRGLERNFLETVGLTPAAYRRDQLAHSNDGATRPPNRT